MNLVNYGTLEEKCKHSFSFFDIRNKGIIEKEDFRTTILSLCEFFSSVSISQCKIFVKLVKIREQDIELIYDQILEKTENGILDLNAYINVSANYPEILDFFDIFNNKIMQSFTIKTAKTTLKKVDNLSSSLKLMLDRLKNPMPNKELTFILKDCLDSINEKISELSKKGQRTDSWSDNLDLSTKKSARRDSFVFGVSERVYNKFSEVDFDDDELDISDSEFNDIDEGLAHSFVNEMANQPKPRSNTFNISADNDFKIMAPAPIIDPSVTEQLKSAGVELENCLIIKNKDSFINYFSQLAQSVQEIINEYNHPKIRIDPKKRNSKVKRRQAFSVAPDNEKTLTKDDYLNSPFLHKQEKGLIHFGNENVELVLNMMIGIRTAVNSIGDCRKAFNLIRNDDAFKEYNLFNFTQNSFDREIVSKF